MRREMPWKMQRFIECWLFTKLVFSFYSDRDSSKKNFFTAIPIAWFYFSGAAEKNCKKKNDKDRAMTIMAAIKNRMKSQEINKPEIFEFIR